MMKKVLVLVVICCAMLSACEQQQSGNGNEPVGREAFVGEYNLTGEGEVAVELESVLSSTPIEQKQPVSFENNTMTISIDSTSEDGVIIYSDALDAAAHATLKKGKLKVDNVSGEREENIYGFNLKCKYLTTISDIAAPVKRQTAFNLTVLLNATEPTTGIKIKSTTTIKCVAEKKE